VDYDVIIETAERRYVWNRSLTVNVWERSLVGAEEVPGWTEIDVFEFSEPPTFEDFAEAVERREVEWREEQ
jgi:hypothetical protein